ncbi:hypothetical protein DFH29DRAFT_1042399 [Suillus ampliporus]|nr:hypothetical protein DFH29DRAFT_1042399 [Suillus ampliporus]
MYRAQAARGNPDQTSKAGGGGSTIEDGLQHADDRRLPTTSQDSCHYARTHGTPHLIYLARTPHYTEHPYEASEATPMSGLISGMAICPPEKPGQIRGTSPAERRGAGSKAVTKRKLDDGAGDVPTASKRSRKMVQPRTTGGFKSPFVALGFTPAHLASPQMVQTFDTVLPEHQRYDAYIHPGVINTEPNLSEASDDLSAPLDIPIDSAIDLLIDQAI